MDKAYFVFSYYYRCERDDDDEYDSDYTRETRYDHMFDLQRTRSMYASSTYSDREWLEIPENDLTYEGPWVVVYSLYTDGSTFGETNGYVDLWGVFRPEQTEEIEKAREKAHKGHNGWFSHTDSVETIEFETAPWI